MKWTYFTMELEKRITQKQLDEMGEAGWELAAATSQMGGLYPYNYIFKQPKKED